MIGHRIGQTIIEFTDGRRLGESGQRKLDTRRTVGQYARFGVRPEGCDIDQNVELVSPNCLCGAVFIKRSHGNLPCARGLKLFPIGSVEGTDGIHMHFHAPMIMMDDEKMHEVRDKRLGKIDQIAYPQ